MATPIWRRVHECAQELTRQGRTPFTRKDLERCIQGSDPDCPSSSINPVIQGITDNLKGGAPGAEGKGLLHSVGRGQFVLKTPDRRHVPQRVETQAQDGQTSSAEGELEGPSPEDPAVTSANASVMDIGGYSFEFVCAIDAERDADGAVKEDEPRFRYMPGAGMLLNHYGEGPFCKFRIPSDRNEAGLYALLVDQAVQYVGECRDLSTRFNMGYGNISPRNCFVGGQETNCRINRAILDALKAGSEVTLWFRWTADFKRVEAELRRGCQPPWNRV